MVLTVFNQYSNAKPMIKGLPSWISGLDAERIASYNLYEQMYWNIPEALSLVIRGSDQNLIYIPSARQIVETMHRYLAPDISVIADPSLGTPTERNEAMAWIVAFLRRERFSSGFSADKRFGIIRGDWIAYLYADPERQPGTRVSLEFIDPARYFPIENPDNVSEIIGAHIVETLTLDDGEFIRRLTYRKQSGVGGPSPIDVTDELYELDDWGGPGMDAVSPVRSLQKPFTLPDPIDQIPIYHIRNFDETGAVFGSSEIRGFERLIAAINQGISDEELSLVLEGLGVYATDAGQPVNEAGEPQPWNLGPGKVVELPGSDNTFVRVNGIGSVSPYQEHLQYLHDQLDLSTGTPAIAKGRIDVDVAESGIALQLEMGPILARAGEKELEITDTLVNMLFDLRSWFIAYEGQRFDSIAWLPAYGPKLPVNVARKFDEIMRMVTESIVSRRWARAELAKIGYSFPDEQTIIDEILDERRAIAQIGADIEGERIDRETGDVE